MTDSLLKLIQNLQDRVKLLEDQVKELQYENVETTNSIYEIANSLESRIDILASESYDFSKYSTNQGYPMEQ